MAQIITQQYRFTCSESAAQAGRARPPVDDELSGRRRMLEDV